MNKYILNFYSQTQSIDPQYLPKVPPPQSRIAKKADLAILIGPTPAMTEWQRHNPSIGLSHMENGYTRQKPVVCPIGVKYNGGDYREAVCQLGLWSAAALEKLKCLASLKGGDTHAMDVLDGFPYPSLTVVGYEWKLHVSWKEKVTGKVVSGVSLPCDVSVCANLW